METDRSLHSPSRPYSPLKCDEDGNLRILIVGNSGTGKSTMARRLSCILQLPVIHLDTLHFQPNWRKTPDDEFRGMVQQFVRENDSWIIDGNYKSLLGDLTNASATCILWMDPPFVLYFSRLILRTFLRLIRLAPPCSPGCDERLADVFSWGEKSILWWSWTRHTPSQKAHTRAMQLPGDDQGGKWIRVSGWGGEVNALLKQVELFANAQ